MNLERCEVELIKMIFGISFDGISELLFLLGSISFSPGQPTGDDVVSCLIARDGRNSLQCLAGKIDLAEAQRRRRQIKLTVEIVRFQACDLRPPRNRLFQVLFLSCLGQDVKGGQRIRSQMQNLLSQLIRAFKILVLKLAVGALQ